MSKQNPKVDAFVNRAKAWQGEVQRLRSILLDCGLEEDLNTQSALRLEFTSEAQVTKSVVKSYVKQAIAVEKAGLSIDFKAKRELELPEELTQILTNDRKLAKAFHALTPGRQRAYVLHFADAKQSQPRTARIEKSIPKILADRGLNDR